MSTDDGMSWTQIATREFGAPQQADLPAGELPPGVAWHLVVPTPGQLWLMVSYGGLYRSFDDGKSWVYLDLPSEQIAAEGYGVHSVIAFDGQSIWAAGRYGLLHTVDGGVRCETLLLR